MWNVITAIHDEDYYRDTHGRLLQIYIWKVITIIHLEGYYRYTRGNRYTYLRSLKLNERKFITDIHMEDNYSYTLGRLLQIFVYMVITAIHVTLITDV